MRRAVLVFNGASGTHLANGRKAAREASAALLREAGMEVETLHGPLGKQIRHSLHAEADCVVVDGGDGTIRAVIAAHVNAVREGGGEPKPIGLLPGGTMNLLAQDYRVPLDRTEAAHIAATGVARPVDVGIVTTRRGREDVFLHTCLTGMPVRIGMHRERWRGKMPFGGQLFLALHALSTARRDPSVTVRLAAGEALSGRSFAVVVGELGERLMPVPSRATLQGGCLTVIALAADSGMDLMRLALRGITDTLEADPDAKVSITQEAELEGVRRRMHVMLDGEGLLLATPIRLSVRRDAIGILSSPEAVNGGEDG